MARPCARSVLPVALALGAALPLTGCGDPAVVADGTLVLRAREFRFLPQDARAPAGRLRVVLRNEGRLVHNVRLVPEDGGDSSTGDELGGTTTARGGEQRSFVFRRLEPGTYRFLCTIGNHDDLGLYGTLEVEP